MVATGQKRGHRLYYDGYTWKYINDDTPAENEKPCIRCGEHPTKEGHDHCLGTLPNTSNACCGHGIRNPYRRRNN